MFTLITPKAKDASMRLAFSRYQLQLLQGLRPWNGTDLKGEDAETVRHHGVERELLLMRISDAGLWWDYTRGWRGRIVVVIMTNRERRAGWDNRPEYIALAAIDKAAAAAERKAERAQARR
ncbi:hypothetical protein [Methylorubrum extorquens]|uniref:Uncharacterized protein n=1 Tax=Methylorubrum extorquens (strain ATCC 14718 / DSM 1338 / JCM 2805 / NCIMB 9133 / AM1) TaxID=272630 RepID=C5B668_METEA|nr:hypothetical protein [Methylorubrum extorquens]ACS43950.1 Hypothetical protein MexAM1_META2p1186 [Methylorubrum extorquens AM1]MCP1546197.1 hypothetical protein [Methylorubrum extorquens]MCP1590864.1 hypothetical protein [Methylorubrum extorquens]